MFQWQLFHTLSLLACLSTAQAHLTPAVDLDHASANIFNSIHSAMRHWGTSINPNGMSFFLASVPKGTRFYHGTGLSEPIQGLEWLAFTPEHSLGFAHRSGHKFRRNDLFTNEDMAQSPLNPLDQQPLVDGNGYLHTYATARDLRLVYIDGWSGGPGAGAESQDRILFNDTITGQRPASGPKLGGPPEEQQRAIEMCRMANEEFGGRIDGVVRTEGDFEIILCAFERDLEVLQITQTKPQPEFQPPKKGKKGKGPRRGGPGPQRRGDFKSLATRFDEVLGRQVRLDFDHFVSAFSYGLDLFPNNATKPELGHISIQELYPIREDVIQLVKTREPSLYAFDWQAVVDMIIFRYSNELQNLAAGNFSTASALRDHLEQLLEPFVDYRDAQNEEVILERCQYEFIPTSAPVDSVGGRAVRSVSRSICSTLIFPLAEDVDLEVALSGFRQLVSFLKWTTWEDK